MCTEIDIGHIAKFTKKKKKKRWRRNILDDLEMMSGTHWPCVTLSLSCPFFMDVFLYLLKKAILFYVTRNFEFSIISYQGSKAIIALFG